MMGWVMTRTIYDTKSDSKAEAREKCQPTTAYLESTAKIAASKRSVMGLSIFARVCRETG